MLIVNVSAARSPMRPCRQRLLVMASGLINLTMNPNGLAQESPVQENPTNAPVQNWNWHVQNTDIVQGYPGFPAKYSGPNSLPGGGETRETVSLDLYAGVRLWPGPRRTSTA